MNDADYRETIERETVLTRVFDHPRDRVFAAWTDPDKLPAWFGPAGFRCDTRSIDLSVGGSWCFDMIAPDGTCYSSRMTFLEIEEPALLVMDHGHDVDDDPDRFRVTVTFEEQADGRTVLTMRQLHRSAAARAVTINFGAVALGYQTLDKLDAALRAAAD
jgi:uncharacterized protein YndB with AHSA1/START domain